jgi:hypothetical protein
VNHFAAPEFWQAFENLPDNVQVLARKNFELLKATPKHPSLHFKKTGRFWSARASLGYRALAVEDNNDLVWFWIGGHDKYLQIIKAS